MKPNCYESTHRGIIPGDAHSCCKHPSNTASLEDSLLMLLAISGSVSTLPTPSAKTGLNVKGNRHGIANGWFSWPFNFDPVWLESCDGFEAVEEES